jgi:hypothetical protein
VAVFKQRKKCLAGRWWLTPVILATQEAEISRIVVQSQPRLVSDWKCGTYKKHCESTLNMNMSYLHSLHRVFCFVLFLTCLATNGEAISGRQRQI